MRSTKLVPGVALALSLQACGGPEGLSPPERLSEAAGEPVGVMAQAARLGIDVLPGPTFSSENALDSFIRLAFAASAETLMAGIDGLAAVWHNMRSSHVSRQGTA